ncbi:MAG: hypothetical protein FWG50_01350 [Kiritimatiellaeota bacterium]|nr:hypothetical protein [Kiritimatiellota bacterium]
MKYKKRITCLLLVPAVLFAYVLFFGAIMPCARFALYARPLIPASQWQVKSGTHTGESISVKTYQVKGHETFFLCVGNERPEWFAVDFSGIKHKLTWHAFPDDAVHVLYMAPRIFPFLHYNINGQRGRDILDAKTDRLWYLSDTGDTIVFSNEVFFVSMTNENSGRPPVEVHKVSWAERIDDTPPEWDGVMGLDLTFFDKNADAEGWAVHISVPFRDSRDAKAVAHPPGFVLSNTSDVTATATRTIYIDAGQNVRFRPERAKTGLTNGAEHLEFKADAFISESLPSR